LSTTPNECDPAGSCRDLSRHVPSTRLAAVQQNVSEAAADSSDCDLARYAKQIPIELIGKPALDADRLTRVWQGLGARLEHIRALNRRSSGRVYESNRSGDGQRRR
jgi:hypothetical protein